MERQRLAGTAFNVQVDDDEDDDRDPDDEEPEVDEDEEDDDEEEVWQVRLTAGEEIPTLAGLFRFARRRAPRPRLLPWPHTLRFLSGPWAPGMSPGFSHIGGHGYADRDNRTAPHR